MSRDPDTLQELRVSLDADAAKVLAAADNLPSAVELRLLWRLARLEKRIAAIEAAYAKP